MPNNVTPKSNKEINLLFTYSSKIQSSFIPSILVEIMPLQCKYLHVQPTWNTYGSLSLW